jgi:hypothetical protein
MKCKECKKDKKDRIYMKRKSYIYQDCDDLFLIKVCEECGKELERYKFLKEKVKI